MFSSKYFRRLQVIILLTSIIPVLVFAGYSSFSKRAYLREQVREANMELLNKTKNYVEETLRFIQNYYTLMLLYEGNGKWESLAIDYRRSLAIEEIQKKLAGGIITYDIIKEVILINNNYDWVISQARVSTFSDRQDYERIMELIRTDANIFWTYVPFGEDLPNTLIKGGLVLIIKSSMVGESQSFPVLLINLSSYQFEKLFNHKDELYPVIVVNNQGIILYDGQDGRVGSSYTSVPFLENVALSELTEKGSFYNRELELYFNYSTSDTGLTYFSYYSEEDLSLQTAAFADAALLISIILVLFLTGLTFFETRFMYKPLKDIVQRLFGRTEAAGEKGPKDEFDMISQSIGELLSTNNKLQHEVEKSVPLMEELFFTKLLKGTETEAEAGKMVVALGKAGDWRQMILFALEIEGEYESSLDYDFYLLQAAKEACGVIPQESTLKHTVLDGKAFFLLSGSHTMMEGFMEDTYKLGLEITRRIRESLEVDVVLGFSSVFREFGYASRAYRECLNALIYRNFVESDAASAGKMVFFNDLKPRSDRGGEYPKTLVSELVKEIRNINEERVGHLLEEIVKNLFRHEGDVNEFQFYLLRFTADILLILDVGHSYCKVFQMRSTICEELSKITGPESMREFFLKKLIIPVMETIKENASPQDVIIEKMLDIIHREFEQDLDIESCAARLNYHPTYIWRVMKNKMNTTFQDYLIQYRMEMAKRWLYETEMTVGEIAERLKYNNAQNFIRSFKKIVGTTPGRYREMERQLTTE